MKMPNAREQRALRRDQLMLLSKVMSEPIGRAYFYDLLASCHVYSTSFGTNAIGMAFREGERNVGLRIGADLTEASPAMYLEMLKEAESGKRTIESDRARREPAERGFGTDEPDGDPVDE